MSILYIYYIMCIHIYICVYYIYIYIVYYYILFLYDGLWDDIMINRRNLAYPFWQLPWIFPTRRIAVWIPLAYLIIVSPRNCPQKHGWTFL